MKNIHVNCVCGDAVSKTDCRNVSMILINSFSKKRISTMYVLKRYTVMIFLLWKYIEIYLMKFMINVCLNGFGDLLILMSFWILL